VSQAELSMSFAVEAIVAALVVVAFVVIAMVSLKERHFDVDAWHVYVGAGIYGAIIGIIIGFVVVPLRAMLTDISLPPYIAAISGFAVLALMISLRQGLIGRLPFLGPQVKAYRRAMLRRSIETAQKQLDKLTPQAAAE
jgi:hypothetical protein